MAPHMCVFVYLDCCPGSLLFCCRCDGRLLLLQLQIRAVSLVCDLPGVHVLLRVLRVLHGPRLLAALPRALQAAGRAVPLTTWALKIFQLFIVLFFIFFFKQDAEPE